MNCKCGHDILSHGPFNQDGYLNACKECEDCKGYSAEDIN